MSVVYFCKDLLDDGRVGVPPISPFTQADEQDVKQLLTSFDEQYRDCLAGEPPPLVQDAACWSAAMVHRATKLA